MIAAVLKVGGSLSKGEQLPVLCQQIARLGSQYRLLVVPGGGVFADAVREYDRRYHLSDYASHWMAILAMDQYGYLLSDLIPDSQRVGDLASAQKVAAAGRVPVLLPFQLLWLADALPHSWQVTGDSIAAWVAKSAGAPLLVLLKDVDGLYTSAPAGQGDELLLRQVSLDQLAACRGVDRYLPSLLTSPKLVLWIINGEKPDRLAELLATGQTEGTRFQRSAPSSAALSGYPLHH